MADLDELTMAKLARELTMNIRNYKLVFKDYGIDENDYCEIEKNPFYRKIKEHYVLEWNSAISTADRIKLQGAAGVEAVMRVVTKRALAVTEPLTSVIEGAKFLAKVAGIGETKTDPKAASDRFVITINLGADTEHYNKSIEINPNDIDPNALKLVKEYPADHPAPGDLGSVPL